MDTGNLEEFKYNVEKLGDLQKELNIISTADNQMKDKHLSKRIDWKIDEFPGENGASFSDVVRNTNVGVSLLQNCRYTSDLSAYKLYAHEECERNSPLFRKYFIKSLNKNIQVIVEDMKDMLSEEIMTTENTLKEMTSKIMKGL